MDEGPGGHQARRNHPCASGRQLAAERAGRGTCHGAAGICDWVEGPMKGRICGLMDCWIVGGNAPSPRIEDEDEDDFQGGVWIEGVKASVERDKTPDWSWGDWLRLGPGRWLYSCLD